MVASIDILGSHLVVDSRVCEQSITSSCSSWIFPFQHCQADLDELLQSCCFDRIGSISTAWTPFCNTFWSGQVDLVDAHRDTGAPLGEWWSLGCRMSQVLLFDATCWGWIKHFGSMTVAFDGATHHKPS